MAIVGRVRHKTLDLKIAVQILSDGKVVFDQQHPGLEHSHGMPSAQRLGSVAHQGTNTLPGFIRPWGSSTCLMRCISASSIGSLYLGRASRLSCPTPCSALIDPTKRCTLSCTSS